MQAVNDKFLALIPPLWYPTFLILYTIKRLIFPLRARLPLWTAIKHVAMAPFITPTFFVTYVGDVFTSMVKVFQDLLFAVCFLAYGDFLLSDDLLDTEPHGRLPQAWAHTFWYCSYLLKQISTLTYKSAPGHKFYYRSYDVSTENLPLLRVIMKITGSRIRICIRNTDWCQKLGKSPDFNRWRLSRN